MAFTERLQTIDRRVAYGAALVIAVGGLATMCGNPENVDPNDTTTWNGMGVHENSTPDRDNSPQTAPEVLPTTFDLQALNLAEVPNS